MSLRAKPAGAGPRGAAIVLPGNIPGQTNLQPVSSFLYRVNPANWFNEFSAISITLEEFAPVKSMQGTNSKKPG